MPDHPTSAGELRVHTLGDIVQCFGLTILLCPLAYQESCVMVSEMVLGSSPQTHSGERHSDQPDRRGLGRPGCHGGGNRQVARQPLPAQDRTSRITYVCMYIHTYSY